MAKKILIDATHNEETRAAVIENGILQDFEIETITKKEVKGNVYLAKVIRVEPSLQAAFLDYGGNRHGFLPFGEIHPDYFQIPIEDKKALLAQSGDDDEDDDGPSSAADDEDFRRGDLPHKYKIQEVIKSGQVMLVQVEKEERGNKGAAITTYISLAGSYCVLMPNSNKRVKFGVSRKLAFNEERKELKNNLKRLPIPDGMTIIARTAAASKTYSELMNDYDYMVGMWNEIRKKTLAATAPALVHDDGNLVQRAIRDMFKPDTDEILIEGEAAYTQAVDFAKLIRFAEPKRIVQYKHPAPLFVAYKVESQLEEVQSPSVRLPSGGYLVINPAEALTAIDVNSGRATKEHDIAETALKTNIEAAVEIARQLRLRDMGGLIVIDFIDMAEAKHDIQVENKMREVLKHDRAKVQIAKLSQFGLMEVSRQRLRPSFLEVSHKVCPHCLGMGYVPSVQTASLNLLRHIEEELLKKHSDRIYAAAPADVALYTLNQKRGDILDIEERYNTSVVVNGDDGILNEKGYVIERMGLDARAAGYLREKDAAGSRPRSGKRQQESADLIKKTRVSKVERPAPKGKKRGFLAKLFG
ncbi:MAG: ribonuclease E/G [Rickettsiales bacterium]|jgi:ribonuclease E|nr:ribonuclease E/G [Rickettsiales bacterium]